jgi:DNA-binding transcriptional regulator YiaG
MYYQNIFLEEEKNMKSIDESISFIEQGMTDVYDAEKSMMTGLEKSGKMFIPIKDMVRNIPQDLRNRLEIKVSAPVKKLRQQIERLLGQRLKIYPVKKATYVGKNIPSDEMIAQIIDKHPDISLKLICQKLPLTRQKLIETINALIAAGIVLPRLNDKMNIFFTLKDAVFAQSENIRTRMKEYESIHSDEKAIADFHDAYKSVGKGRNFVRIHRIREALKWSDQTFDTVLKILMQNYKVELHGGDPSSMSETEIANSYKDDNGRLFLTISWR